MNKSSNFSTLKNNFAGEKRKSFNQITYIREQQMSNQDNIMKRNFSLVNEKPMYRSESLIVSKNNQKDNKQRYKTKTVYDNKIKFMGKNSISEQTIENDEKHNFENYNKEQNDRKLDNKKSTTSDQLVDYNAKMLKNNLQKFNKTQPKFFSSINFKSNMSPLYKAEKNNHNINLKNQNYYNQMDLSNPKIKIKISNDLSEKIKKSNEYLTDKKGNIFYNSFSDHFEKNLNGNINNNIKNFYSMANLTAEFDDPEKIKIKINEEEIQKKLNIYRIKLNSEMIRLLNQEKSKENDRQIIYDNIKIKEDKNHYEKEVSKDRLESSDKIFKMNK